MTGEGREEERTHGKIKLCCFLLFTLYNIEFEAFFSPNAFLYGLPVWAVSSVLKVSLCVCV